MPNVAHFCIWYVHLNNITLPFSVSSYLFVKRTTTLFIAESMFWTLVMTTIALTTRLLVIGLYPDQIPCSKI
uniref:Uncharacterized protein n=1 Tax=Arundo donax TaxID=35708 RepID=A0A0A8YGD7_ARUDO